MVRREQLMYGAGVATQEELVKMHPLMSQGQIDKMTKDMLIKGPTTNMDKVVGGIK